MTKPCAYKCQGCRQELPQSDRSHDLFRDKPGMCQHAPISPQIERRRRRYEARDPLREDDMADMDPSAVANLEIPPDVSATAAASSAAASSSTTAPAPETAPPSRRRRLVLRDTPKYEKTGDTSDEKGDPPDTFLKRDKPREPTPGRSGPKDIQTGMPTFPDWTRFDIGTTMKALRSYNPVVVRKCLKKLHLRWWHAGADRMRKILHAAGIDEVRLSFIDGVVKGCSECRAWARPECHHPLSKYRDEVPRRRRV